MSVETPPLRLQSVQALRGVAALLVVFFHSAEIWREGIGVTSFAGPWDRGWAGVDLFFVISGFVMVWVAADRASGLHTVGRFLYDRATRIYPLWWVFCALMALYFFVTYGQPAAPTDVGSEGAWSVFAQSMALWPMGQTPVLGVGWTLIYEMGFYLLFAVLLLAPAKMRPFGLMLWAVMLILLIIVRPMNAQPDGVWQLLSSPLCVQFCFGAAVGYALKRAPKSSGAGWGLAIIGGLGFLGLMISGVAGPDHVTRTLTFGVAATLLLAGLVWVERGGRLHIPAWLSHLGDVSYTLYLSHFLLLLALRRVAQSAGLYGDPSMASFAVFMVVGTVASVIAALLLYRLLERPLLTLSRRLVTQKA